MFWKKEKQQFISSHHLWVCLFIYLMIGSPTSTILLLFFYFLLIAFQWHSSIWGLLPSQCFDQNNNHHQHTKWQELCRDSTSTQETPFKEYQEAQFDHVPISNSICTNLHWVQRIRNMRMTIITAKIVHSCPILSIRFCYGFVPLFCSSYHEQSVGQIVLLSPAACSIT